MSQAKPGRAKVSQDEPKRRGAAKQSQGGHGEFCWDLEPVGGQEEPRGSRKGQDGPG